MNLFARLKRFGGASKVGHITNASPVDKAVAEQVAAENGSVEVYKIVTEDKLPAESKQQAKTETQSNMVQDERIATDGADEQMLGADDKLTERRDEVKFIKGGDHQNGDAKIDINVNGKQAFTGMSKEELMKYANDPFWVRLRWIFFIGFWAIWLGMLVGAIVIILGAPKCAAPQPWYKRGLHAKFGSIENAVAADVTTAQKLSAAGAIYELPARLTYAVKQPEVESQIKQLVTYYTSSNVRVIIDLTPNYMSNKSQLFKDALQNEDKRAAFMWVSDSAGNVPNNWLKVNGKRSAWDKLDNSYVLSQFEDGYYDLQMNHTLVRREFSNVLHHLLSLGVQGFRLNNTKFFLLSQDHKDEDISHNPSDRDADLNDYSFYNHAQTTFQAGLGAVLNHYRQVVRNASADAFLSVTEDILRPEVYQISNIGNTLGIDLPMYGKFVKSVSSYKEQKLHNELQQTLKQVGNSSWVQWNFADVYFDTPVNPSAVAYFMSLLPGVPVVPVDSVEFENVTAITYRHIKKLRESASYMHGELKLYEAGAVIAYSRTKSGNPGIFVVFNPTAAKQPLVLVNAPDLPSSMEVGHVSENYLNISSTTIKVGGSVNHAELNLEPYSTVILTYVPIKAE